MGAFASKKPASIKPAVNPIAKLRLQYNIDPKPIGTGHYGRVFQGTKHNGEKVALKIIPKKNLSLIERLDLQKEAQILDQLNHPNVLKLIDYQDSDDYLVLVTELVEGKDLQQVMLERLESGADFSEESVVDIARQLLQALDYIHKAGVMHRDIKPANVVISPDGSVKLIDFGLAEYTNNFQHLLAGTPYYMAPEVIDQPHKERCDVWSLGVLVYVLLTGYRPFEGETREEVLEKIQKQRLSFPDQVELSEEARDFLLQLLMKNPKFRPSAEKCLKFSFFDERSDTPNYNDILLKQPLTFSNKFSKVSFAPKLNECETPLRRKIGDAVADLSEKFPSQAGNIWSLDHSTKQNSEQEELEELENSINDLYERAKELHVMTHELVEEANAL